MPAPLRHRQPARDAARPQLPDRALAHRERQPVVVVAVRDERRRRVVALADLPQRADGLHLRDGRGGQGLPVVGGLGGGGGAGLVGQAVHEEGDRLRGPAHVEDYFGAGVGEGEGEGHGALFADGGVFDYLWPG